MDFTDATQFLQYGDYYLSTHPQGTTPWKNLRGGLLTASKFRRCRNLDPWSNIDELIDDIKNKTDSTESNYIMQLGNFYESYARDFYVQKYNYVVKEVGLAIPRWDTRIGASSDGIIYDPSDLTKPIGIIEIKSPAHIYDKLYAHYRKYINGKPIGDINHIKPEHYDQMQGNMAILNLNFCDYIVFSYEDRKAYVERVPFDKVYWDTVLYPDLCSFLDLIV